MVEAHGRHPTDAVTPAGLPAVGSDAPAFAAALVEIGPGEQARLVAALREPSRHGPDCTRVDLLETHISYVLLTGVHAYKIRRRSPSSSSISARSPRAVSTATRSCG